jgi:hypothetical protein
LKVINRYLIFFFFLVFSLFFGISQILQTSFIGKKISKELTTQVFKKYGLEIKFEKIEVGLFPPTSSLKNVELRSKENAEFNLKLEAASFGLQFSFFDLFNKSFTISKILIFDAAIRLKTPGKEKKEFEIKEINKFQFKEFFSIYKKNIIEKMPVRIKELEFDTIDLEIDGKKFFVNKLFFGLSGRKIVAEGSVENENLIMFSALYPGEQEIDFNFELNENGAKIKKINFKNRQDFVNIQGDISNTGNSLELDGKIDFLVKMETLAKAFPNFSALKEMDGMIFGKSSISKNILDPDFKFQLSIFDFVSQYIDMEEIELVGEKKGSGLLISSLKGKDGSATLEFKEPVSFVDMGKINLNNFKIKLIVNNFFTNKIIKFVPALEPIKGYLSGEFEINLENKNLNFLLGENFTARNFLLQFKDVPKPILKNEEIAIGGLKISVLSNEIVEVEGNLSFKKSKVFVKGRVLNKENSIEFKGKSDPLFDFTDFGPISGVDIKGAGTIDLTVAGPKKDVKITFDSELKDFGFLGFNLGDILGHIEYDINKKTLTVSDINSTINNSEISGSGELVFGENSNINFHIFTPHITFQDSLIIYEPLVKNISWLKQKDDFEYLADYKITGPIDPKKLVVKGYFKGGESFFLGEQINSFEGKYSYQDQKIKISNLTIENGKGKGSLNLEFDMPTSNFNYTAEIQGIRLSDIEAINYLNLGLDGEVVGISKGERRQGPLKTSSNFNLLSTKIGAEEIDDSHIEIETDGGKVNLSGNFFGKYLLFKSYLDFAPLKNAKNSFFDLKIQAEKLPLFTGIISAHNVVNPSLSGELFAELSSSFDITHPEFLNLALKLDKFSWINEENEFGLKSNKNSILIKDGQIEKWDIEFRGNEDYFTSKANGKISGLYTIKNDFLINSQVFQLFTPNISQVVGKTQGNVQIDGNFPKLDYTIFLDSNLDKLKFSNLPGIFEDFKISLSQKKSLLSINKFKGKYGKGDVSVVGNIKFIGKDPQINLNYELANINYPFFKKSSANFSGKGTLQGDSKPYNLEGDFLLGFADVRDTPKDLMKGQGPAVNYDRFLPKKISSLEGAYLNLDLKMDLANRLVIKNKIADIRLGGEIAVSGDNKNKIISGNFSAIPLMSKFDFKGNSFVINEGVIELQNYPKESPYLRLSASSLIKKYDVRVNVNGKINKMVIDLSSEPSLAREDILSLITLGFTSKDAVGLSEREKETMTSVGIGSLLADQLELSQGLTSDFGISLSVTPELEEIEKSNQPNTREGSVLPTQSKFKSATKIGFKKQISEKAEISFSNTIGGSIDQKQEVSGEYYLNKNTSVRGTYEMFNSQQREIQDSGAQSNNLGVDLIFKWSYK